MTEVKMLRTVPISLDGINVQIWNVGSIQNATDDLVSILIDLGAIDLMTQAHGAAPENKAVTKRGRPRKISK